MVIEGGTRVTPVGRGPNVADAVETGASTNAAVVVDGVAE